MALARERMNPIKLTDWSDKSATLVNHTWANAFEVHGHCRISSTEPYYRYRCAENEDGAAPFTATVVTWGGNGGEGYSITVTEAPDEILALIVAAEHEEHLWQAKLAALTGLLANPTIHHSDVACLAADDANALLAAETIVNGEQINLSVYRVTRGKLKQLVDETAAPLLKRITALEAELKDAQLVEPSAVIIEGLRHLNDAIDFEVQQWISPEPNAHITFRNALKYDVEQTFKPLLAERDKLRAELAQTEEDRVTVVTARDKLREHIESGGTYAQVLVAAAEL